MTPKITISVAGIPPKKDGANSMWRKGSEMERVIALRLAASQSMHGHSLAQSWVHMSVRVYANPTDGDLDNFITGICDSLTAAHSRTPSTRPIGIMSLRLPNHQNASHSPQSVPICESAIKSVAKSVPVRYPFPSPLHHP